MEKIKLSPYHLTFYFEQVIKPERYDYNITFIQRIKGSLDLERLTKAINRFVSENFLYHSSVIEENGQYFWKKSKIFPPLEKYETATAAKIDNFIKQPFNLAKTPGCRFAIFKLGNGSYIFTVVVHHIIMDGAKGNKLVIEISNYYNNKSYKNTQSTRILT